MKFSYLFALIAFACANHAQAEIYKRVDADGHVTYSSVPIKGGKKVHLEPLPVMAPTPVQGSNRRSENNSDFRVDSETQRNRDQARRQILQDELATEQKALEEARRNLQEGEANPEVYKTADGKTYRNVAKYEEKVKALQEQVQTHEKNIDALNTELSNLNK